VSGKLSGNERHVYTQPSLQEIKLASCEEQGLSSLAVVLLKQNINYEKSQELKGRPEKFKNQ
jgi:hypothetical protein